jgi:zinc and cadmium transporter
MTVYSWLALYCGLILCLSLFGGCLPFLGRVSHNRLQLYLSASAGVMLGASFFHVMPEAIDKLKEYGAAFGWWMSLGVVGLFCIERFIAPHSHELDREGHHGHHDPAHDHDSVCAHNHNHGHSDEKAGDHRAAAPSVAGWMAVLGLTIHTFMNGVALAASVDEEAGSATLAALPGFAIFLAIFLHKPADALAISTILSRKGTSKRKLFLVQLGFVLMVPVGVIAYYLTKQQIEKELEGYLAGAALAFSSGTFLFIALSDLLPEVQFHRHDRIPLFLALIAGVGLMGGIAALEGHEHGHGEHNGHDKHEERDHDHEKTKDHGGEHGKKQHHDE